MGDRFIGSVIIISMIVLLTSASFSVYVYLVYQLNFSEMWTSIGIIIFYLFVNLYIHFKPSSHKHKEVKKK